MHPINLGKFCFWASLLGLVILLLVFALNYAYVGDESFHLLAARLITAGKSPYKDFFYQHPPLFIYLIASLMRIAGSGWQVVHIFSALATVAATTLAALYASSLYSEDSWRWFAATLTVVLLGLNCYVLVFATTGLPFGFCLLCLLAALFLSRFRTRTTLFVAGLAVGASAAANLLTLPASIVLFFWFSYRTRRNVIAFAAGIFLAFAPLIILFLTSWRQTSMEVITYHLVYRPNLGWRYNLHEIRNWVWSLQGATLVSMSLAALWFRKDQQVRLCAVIAVAIGAGIALAKTTAAFYFLLVTPFLAILAVVAITEIARRTAASGRIGVAILFLVYVSGLSGLRYVWRWEAPYLDHRVAAEIAHELTTCAPSGNFYAFEAVYLEADRLPPPGLENVFNPFSERESWLSAGRFDAVCLGATNPAIEKFGVSRRYAIQKSIDANGYTYIIFCPRSP